ncbi:MAG: glycosidase [Melioribacteraceae bacterium]|nr:glycosidase [Melioribacteraceae bacterium]
MAAYNPSLYEINTRVWLKQFGTEDQPVKLDDVPVDYWKELNSKGIDYVWLMGVWKTSQSTIDKYCFEEGLIKEYNEALPGWQRADVIGSPFAINVYEVNPLLGNISSLKKLKRELNKLDLKLILDFVPNHFSAHSSLLESHPSIFLTANEKLFGNDSQTFYKPFDDERVFAHGRDPYFPAWQDTVQVNYFQSDAQNYMTDILLELTELCDGVRCDMAMLQLNDVFLKTWENVSKEMHYTKSEKEFWNTSIEKVKNKRSDFIFMAEAYWDLEWRLQQLGFDYTYDKRLLDRLINNDVQQIKNHLKADEVYQEKSVRFLENHDEERAVRSLGNEKSKAAAVIISTIPGIRFFNDGQFEGKKIKLPVQLGRESVEEINPDIQTFYDLLLTITKGEIFKSGDWNLLDLLPAWEENETYKNILAWEWKYKNERRTVFVNYSNITSVCKGRIDIQKSNKDIIFDDLLNDESYVRTIDEIRENGLFIELKRYQSHIFSY